MVADFQTDEKKLLLKGLWVSFQETLHATVPLKVVSDQVWIIDLNVDNFEKLLFLNGVSVQLNPKLAIHWNNLSNDVLTIFQ